MLRDKLIALMSNFMTSISGQLNYGERDKSWANRSVHEHWLIDADLPTLEEWAELDVETCKLLGFRKWDDNGNFLIPAYLYKVLPRGLKVTSITDETRVVGHDYISDDERSGMLSIFIPVKPGIRFRFHRGTVEDSLATTTFVKNRQELKSLILNAYLKEDGFIHIYRFDEGIKDKGEWATHFVTLDGAIVGMIEGVLTN